MLAAGPEPDWPADAGRAARADAARRLAAAAVAGPGLLAPQQVVATARACAPPQTIATVDAGAHMLVAMPLWEVPGPRMLLTSSGLATMGYALPAAIAAALCAPDAPVLAFTGDGGLGMTLAEIETAVRLSLRVIVVVFNDSALSLIKIRAEAGRAGRRGGGPVRPGLVRGRRGRDGRRGRRGEHRAGTGGGAGGRAGPAWSHRDRR